MQPSGEKKTQDLTEEELQQCIALLHRLHDDASLWGRYWGSHEEIDCLHFEVCYYQAIEYAIAHKLDRVEAGAQGEHTLARGYMPTATYSAHWIPNPSFRRAVANYLDDERRYVERARDQLAKYGPYRKGPTPGADVPVDADND